MAIGSGTVALTDSIEFCQPRVVLLQIGSLLRLNMVRNNSNFSTLIYIRYLIPAVYPVIRAINVKAACALYSNVLCRRTEKGGVMCDRVVWNRGGSRQRQTDTRKWENESGGSGRLTRLLGSHVKRVLEGAAALISFLHRSLLSGSLVCHGRGSSIFTFS